MERNLEHARGLIADATAVAVLTGAGISAESGIPTFRDALTGLWENFRPEELATAEAFAANPKLVWDWYAWRRAKVSEAVPNPGHRALVAIESAWHDVASISRSSPRTSTACIMPPGAGAWSSCTATSGA